MSVKEYQIEVKELLERHFDDHVKKEWCTKMGRKLYSPRVDMAVGPFSIENGVWLTEDYDRLFDSHLPLISELALQHLINIEALRDKKDDNANDLLQEKMDHLRHTNWNSRCFMAIEVENKSSRKHLMGGAVNAIALGRIGIAVGFDEGKHKAFLNLNRYFEFLQQVDKPTIRTHNLLIISREQLIKILCRKYK
jgi:hypothetical protein